jgi:8-oxo-dGTP pyrophosphatase MutT (NUDIX family)
MSMSVNITAAVLFTNGKQFLVCHPTNSGPKRTWSFPKGLIDENETPYQAACREVEEETGIIIQEKYLAPIDIFPYKPDKKLFLFYYRVNVIDIDSLQCKSIFIDEDGKEKKEVDKYAWIDFEKSSKYLNRGQDQILQSVIQRIKNNFAIDAHFNPKYPELADRILYEYKDVFDYLKDR